MLTPAQRHEVVGTLYALSSSLQRTRQARNAVIAAAAAATLPSAALVHAGMNCLGEQLLAVNDLEQRLRGERGEGEGPRDVSERKRRLVAPAPWPPMDALARMKHLVPCRAQAHRVGGSVGAHGQLLSGAHGRRVGWWWGGGCVGPPVLWGCQTCQSSPPAHTPPTTPSRSHPPAHCCCQVLSPVQRARLVAACHPCFPDFPRVAAAVAAAGPAAWVKQEDKVAWPGTPGL